MTNDRRSAERAAKVEWIRRVAAESGDGCRDWPWALKTNGYGVVRWEGRVEPVGRVVLVESGRPIPFPGAAMLHSCDRRQCAAPWHLRWGTNLENIVEKVERGRTARGTINGLSKLTEEQVILIRATPGRTARSFASEFGVHPTVVEKVRRGQTWKHLLPRESA